LSLLACGAVELRGTCRGVTLASVDGRGGGGREVFGGGFALQLAPRAVEVEAVLVVELLSEANSLSPR
jgi:hypothetical protein